MQYFDWIVNLFATGGLIVILVFIGLIILSFILQVLFLKVGVKAVKGSNTKFGSVFVTALINLLCTLIPCIGCILQWVVINARHKTGFGKAILAWLIAILIPWAIVMAIGLIIVFTGIIEIPPLPT